MNNFVQTPAQNQLFSSVGSSSSGSSKQIYESKQSSSSFSETITKSGGAKFVWPPQRGEDDGTGSGEVGTSIPIQQEQNTYSASNSTNYSTFGSSPTTSGGINIPINTTYSPFGGAAAPTPYKPVAPPKPAAFKQQQVPYKPLASLLTTATNTSKPLTPPILPSSQAPAFGGPSNFGGGYGSGGGGGLQAGPPIIGRGKGQFGKGILPNRGKGILNQPGPRIAVCGTCQRQIR